MRKRPKLLVFASGSKDGGGSGFKNLVLCTRNAMLRADIVGVVSNHPSGGVFKHACDLEIPFHQMTAPFDADHYQSIVRQFKADWVSLSGWLKLVEGLDPAHTINIHPGPLPDFGGPGLYGHYVHEAVLDAFRRGEITHSAVTMHFVTEEYDRGPIFFYLPVPIFSEDTPETLGKRVNQAEHHWQPWATDMVVNEYIRLIDGLVRAPDGYRYLPKKTTS